MYILIYTVDGDRYFMSYEWLGCDQLLASCLSKAASSSQLGVHSVLRAVV